MDSSESDKIEPPSSAKATEGEAKPVATGSEPTATTANLPEEEETLGLEMMSFGGKTYIATSILAQKLGYDGDHIARLARQGKVESIKQGKRWYVLRESLEEYRRKADENKRFVASESIKTAKENALRDVLSRRPKIVPSLALFQIVEHLRASLVSLRPLFNNSGFKLILLALFIFSASWLSISWDIADNINEERQSAGILSAIQDTLKFLFEPALEGIYNTKLEDKIVELENDINEIRLNTYTGQKIITKETIREVTGTTLTVSPPKDIQARLLDLEKFSVYTQDKFQTIDNRFSITPTTWALPSGFTPSGIVIAPTVSDNVNNSSVTTGTLSVSGNGSFGTLSGAGLTDCDAAADTLNWDATAGTFSCGTDSGAGATQFKTESSGSTILSTTNILNFDAGMFALNSSGSTETIIRLNWTSAGGPASLSQDELVTGFWTFSNNVSISSQKNIEISGYASASSYFGSAFSAVGDCNDAGDTLGWDAGVFSCGTDAEGGGGGGSGTLQIREFGIFNEPTAATISFEPGHFALASSGSSDDVIVRLDWTNGPASRSRDETISGGWLFDNDLVVRNTSSTPFAKFATTSSGRFGLGDTTPEAFFEVASSSGIVASISNTFFVDATNQRIGVGTSAPGVSLQVVGAASISTNFEVSGYVSASAFWLPSSSGLLSDCSADTKTLNWSSSTGKFSCLNDDLGGGGAANLQVREVGGSGTTQTATISFETAHFAVTTSTSTDVWVKLDWGTGGPASLSESETVTGGWIFNNDLVINNADTNAFAKFATTSSGRFGLGDTTPETFFEIASGSGVVASISNTFFVDATNQRIGIGTSSPNVSLQVVGAASISTGFEVGTYASIGNSTSSNSFGGSLRVSKGLDASSYQGGGLSNCNPVTGKLTWASGQFTCGTDLNTGGSSGNVADGLDINVSGGTFLSIASLTFDAGSFNFSNIGTIGYVRLDWTNGPASRTFDESISGGWLFDNDLVVRNTSSTPFAKFATTSSGRFGLGDTTPEAFFEVASSSGTTASISNTFFVDATNQRIGIGTSAPAVSLQVIGAASISTNFEAIGYVSASAFWLPSSSGLLSDCSGETQTLNWSASTGKFSCLADGGGSASSFSGIEIFNSGVTPALRYGSVSFDSSHFTVTFSDAASTAFIKLDWGDGGPASLSESETVTGGWLFNNDLIVNNIGANAFAKFSSISSGRFGLGDVTPEAFFEVASGSGITASISNIFFVNADSVGASISGNLKVTAASTRAFVVSDNGGNKDDIFTVDTTASGSNPGLDIVATTITLANGTGALTITVPASNSSQGQIPHSALWITDTNSTTLASMSNGGSLALRGYLSAQAAYLNCSSPASHIGKCVDYAENYPTTDTNLKAGDVVGLDEINPLHVVRATKNNNIVGIVSTNPGILLNGERVLIGVNDEKAGQVPVALAGRVPLKVSTENGPIQIGDFLTISSVPGVAMKATKAGHVVGQALEPYPVSDPDSEPGSNSDKEVGLIITFVNVGFYNGVDLEDLAPGIEGDMLAKTLISDWLKNSTNTNISDIFADRIGAELEIITPKISASGLEVDSVGSLNDHGIAVNLSADESFVINRTNDTNSAEQPVIKFDSLGNAFFAGSVTANRISGDIDGLNAINQQIAQLTNSISSTESPQDLEISNLDISGSLTVSGNSLFAGLVTADKITANELDSPILTELKNMIEGNASVSAEINTRLAGLESQREIDIKEMLNLEGGLTVQGLTTLNGGLVVNEIKSADEYIAFTTDTIFFGRPIFNNDTGGFATILEGEKRVEIKYDKEYLENPVVNLTIKSDADGKIFPENIDYVLTDENTDGFAVILNKPAPFDIQFNWTALAVKDPKTFFSIKTEPTPTPLVTPTPLPDATDGTVELSPTPEETPAETTEVEPIIESLISEPLSESTPEPTSSPAVSESPAPSPSTTPELTPTPEPAPEPTLEPAPEIIEPTLTPEIISEPIIQETTSLPEEI